MKIAKDEESHLVRSFFHSFKENFRQSTLIWLILLVLGVFLGVDGYVFYHMRFDSVLWTLGTAVFVIVLAAYAIVWMYIFPLLARFDNTIRAMFKNALMIGMRFLLCTVLMALIYFSMAVVVIRFFTPAIIFGEGLCALLCSYLLSNILLLCEEKTEEGRTDEAQTPETVGSPETSGSRERKWSIKDVHGTAKIGYIWEYYKLPIAVSCIFLYIAGYLIYGRLTHKDTILYTALVNVSASDAFAEELSTGFLAGHGADVGKEQVTIYDGLYLTEDESDVDHGYVYASNTKITGSIAGELLDVVLMDRTAFDILSRNGCFCDLGQLLLQEAPDLYEKLQSCLITDAEGADAYPAAVDISRSDLILKEGFDGTLYLGIIKNAPHMENAVAYLRYLVDSQPY